MKRVIVAGKAKTELNKAELTAINKAGMVGLFMQAIGDSRGKALFDAASAIEPGLKPLKVQEEATDEPR